MKLHEGKLVRVKRKLNDDETLKVGETAIIVDVSPRGDFKILAFSGKVYSFGFAYVDSLEDAR